MPEQWPALRGRPIRLLHSSTTWQNQLHFLVEHCMDNTCLNTHIHCYLPSLLHHAPTCMVEPRSIALPPPSPENFIVFTRKWTGLRTSTDNRDNIIQISHHNRSPGARTAHNRIPRTMRCTAFAAFGREALAPSDVTWRSVRNVNRSPDVATAYHGT